MGWHDRGIGAGDEWKAQIDDHLRSAHIILLLISSDFLTSDYCYDIEMKLALERHDRGEAVVVPIILRDVDWSGSKFSHLQALPKDAKPISSWQNIDEAFADVARGIRKLISRLQSPAPAIVPTPIPVITTSPGIVLPPELPTLSSAAPTSAPPPQIVVHIDPAAFQPPRQVPIPHELPPAAEEFFGRQFEFDRLTARLRTRKNTAVVGFAGMGKTALAATALASVVGETPQSLAASPYPDGVVFLDLYTLRGAAEPAWETLANKLAGPNFLERSPARERATNACQGRNIMVVIEGGEEADGAEGHARIEEILAALSPQNRWLLLTRLSTQAAAAASVTLTDALKADEAAELFESLTRSRVPPIPPAMRDEALKLLEGHPLALTWAGNLLARQDESSTLLVGDWKRKQLPGLSDSSKAQHTLEWLFNRSVDSLDATARRALDAAGLLARVPFPIEAIDAALTDSEMEYPQEGAARQALKALVQSSLLGLTADDRWQFTHVLGYKFARRETGSDPVLRDRLGVWLHGHLSRALAVNAPADEKLPLADALEHLGALLRADDDQHLWRPLAEDALYDFVDRLTAMGRLGQVRLALDAVVGWFERVPEDTAQELDWLRERSSLLERQANILQEQGDLAGAQAACQRSLEIRRRLADADPSNAGRQRDLSVSHNKVGNILQEQGDLAGAQAAFQRSLEISRRLADADPSNAVWQRDLSVSHNNVGNILQEQGDLAGAQAAFQRGLEISRRLADADPSNAVWQRDLSVSHNNVGNILQEQGDLAGAQAAFQRGLEISRRLADADPSNAVWQRDLSVSHNNVGNILQEQGDLAGAQAAFQRSLEIRRRLADADPSNAVWQRDLSVSHNKVGNILQEQGDLAGAQAAFQRGLEISRRLADADPSNAVWQRDLSVSHNNVGNILQEQGDLAGAQTAFQRGLEISRRLADADPSNAVWQRDLSVSHNKVGNILQEQGDLAGAQAAFQRSLEIRRRLADADPSNAGWQRDLSVSHEKIGYILQEQGDRAGAQAAFQRSLEISRRLADADPSNAAWQRDLSYSLTVVAQLHQQMGNHTEALRHAQESLGSPSAWPPSIPPT